MSSQTIKSHLAALTVAGLLGTTAAVTLAPSAALAVPTGGYANLVEKLSPSVVYIEVTEATPADAQVPGLPEGFPLDEFQRRFGQQFPQTPDAEPMRGLGSGFIYSADGQIVTNNHVIDGATSIKVTLADGTSYDATVVGADPLTDVALLQIKADKPLPAVTVGDSDRMRTGDEVLAIGNPFGLGETVTTGIISAKSRNIHAGPYDDFIQTDAAINRGNSGGPLFNNDGEVIGMNTAIFSPGGGSVGIGFAVPSDMIKTVVTDLATDGTISRGWLGVQIKPMSEDIAQVLGYDAPKGAMVEAVSPDSPAAKAGLLPNDIILKVSGTEVKDTQSLQRAIAGLDPDSTVTLTLLRHGKDTDVDVTLGKLPAHNT